jgi:hypothetical protein
MTEYLIKAKSYLALNKKTTNAELVLAHLLQMRTTQSSFKSRELKVVILSRLPEMSETLFRKTLHELRQDGILKKEFGIYTLNLK